MFTNELFTLHQPKKDRCHNDNNNKNRDGGAQPYCPIIHQYC